MTTDGATAHGARAERRARHRRSLIRAPIVQAIDKDMAAPRKKTKRGRPYPLLGPTLS